MTLDKITVTLTFDQMTSNSIEGILWPWAMPHFQYGDYKIPTFNDGTIKFQLFMGPQNLTFYVGTIKFTLFSWEQ